MKKLLLTALLVPAIALAQTYPSPTFSSITLQNPLTAANGGTGATSSTGTGSVVLSNSPTFTGSPVVPGYLTTASAASTYAPLASPSFTGFSQFTNTSSGASIIRMTGNGATTPNKFVGVLGGNFTIYSSSGANQLLALTDAGALSVPSLSTTTPIPLTSGGTNASTATGATSQLQYLQGATGSAARSLTNKFQDSTSVLDFSGVDSTGVADSTTGIQAAITAVCAQPRGGAVVFPAGTYKVSAQLNISCANLSLQGAGTAATLINSSSPGSSVFVFSGFNDALSGMQIAYTSQATAGAAVSLITGANAFLMDSVTINGAFRGISVVNCVSDYFSNLFFNTTTAASGSTIFINGGNDQYFRNITSDNPNATQPRAGFELVSTGGIWVDGIDMIHSGTGFLVDPPSGSSVTYLFISNAAFDTNSNAGIVIAPASGGAVDNVMFTGSWTASSGGVGVSIGGAGTTNGVRFIGHRSINNGAHGIDLPTGGTTLNVSFNDCDVSGNSQSVPGSFFGFHIGANVSNFSITNSLSAPSGLFANTQSRGILVEAGSSNNYIIMGNYTSGNVNSGIFDGGTGTNKIVTPNLQ